MSEGDVRPSLVLRPCGHIIDVPPSRCTIECRCGRTYELWHESGKGWSSRTVPA